MQETSGSVATDTVDGVKEKLNAPSEPTGEGEQPGDQPSAASEAPVAPLPKPKGAVVTNGKPMHELDPKTTIALRRLVGQSVKLQTNYGKARKGKLTRQPAPEGLTLEFDGQSTVYPWTEVLWVVPAKKSGWSR